MSHDAVRRRTVRIAPSAPGARGYDVVIEAGILDGIGAHVRTVAPAVRYVVIADHHVAELFGDRALRSLGANAEVDLVPFEAGEPRKSRETWAKLTDTMIERRVGRDACVVALGGGVTGDLAGFVAATYMRGLPWIQVPTSLLAMIDASVGGKTGVDVPGGKNLVGAFTQPRVVLADPALLTTLPAEEVRCGLAEAVKHGAIADAAYHDGIRRDADRLLAADAAALEALVGRSVEIKAEVVSEDPHERGMRAMLNFGHTIAHALERVTGYAVPHGRAVAIGMVAEARIGEAAGVTRDGTARRIAGVLETLGLPTALPAACPPDALLDAASSDKKARGSRIRWALVSDVGVGARGPAGEWTIEVPDEIVLGALGA